MSDLETLIPAPVELTIAGETLTITPFKIGKLPSMVRACAPFISAFTTFSNFGGTSINWLTLIADHGENVFTALAIGAGKPQAWIEDLDTPDAILLAQAVIEVNADFFISRVLPAVTAAANGITGKITAGATPSKV